MLVAQRVGEQALWRTASLHAQLLYAELTKRGLVSPGACGAP